MLTLLAESWLINLAITNLCQSAKAPFGASYYAKSMVPYWGKGKNPVFVIVCSCHHRHVFGGPRAAHDLGFISNHGLDRG